MQKVQIAFGRPGQQHSACRGLESWSGGMKQNPLFGPYIKGVPIKDMTYAVCAYCNISMIKPPQGGGMQPQNSRTRDHVLCVSTQRKVDSNIWNMRPCCYGCNTLRANLGHCVGALVLAIIETRHRGGGNKTEMAIRLGMLVSNKEKLAKRIAKQAERAAIRAASAAG